jgi:hypothetical protein
MLKELRCCLNNLWQLLVALGDESCSACQQAASGSYVVIYNLTRCICVPIEM